MADDQASPYEVFHQIAEPRLRVALVAAFGADLGREAAVEALVYGWENWDRIKAMDNPVGYLYRVGHRFARRQALRKQVLFPPAPSPSEPWVEPGLPAALNGLSPSQRQAVILICAYRYSYREVAGILRVAPSTIQQHCERGLRKLRSALGVRADV